MDQANYVNKQPAYFLLLLLLTILPLFCLGLFNHGLWTPDEPRVAEIAREMALSGNWAVPTLNQKPFLEHPPLYYASLALVFKVFGVSDSVARIPSAVFAVAGILTLFFLGTMLFGARTGFLSAFVLATTAEYFRVGHWVIVDGALALFIFLALSCFWVAYDTRGRPLKKVFFYGFCYVFCTLAFYTKGFIGLALPGLAVLSFLVFDRNLKEIGKMHLWLGILIFLALTLPWFLSLWHQGGSDFLKVFLLHNHLERFAGGSTGHNQPFYYYFIRFPAVFLPWSLLIVPAAVRLLSKKKWREDVSKTRVLFALCWFLSGFVLLTLVSTKRALYLMPVFAPAALLIGSYIDSTLYWPAAKAFIDRLFSYLFGLLPFLMGVAMIPLYMYSLKTFGSNAEWTMSAYVLFFSAAATLLGLLGLWHATRDEKKFWIFSCASLFSILLFAPVVGVPLIDQHKSFAPFCREVSQKVPANSELYVYQPDETIRGIIPFYTGHFPVELEDFSALIRAAGQDKRLFLVTRDKREKLRKDILSTGRFSLLTVRAMGADNSLALYVTQPPASDAPGRKPHQYMSYRGL